MKPLKILLVDDSKSARYALRLQFKHQGIDVEMADSAEAALERIKIDRPEAVFMDHTMPGMNGLEALEILKADPATAQIPVVMCTSNEEPEYVAEAKEKGALDVLAKSAAKERLPGILEHLAQLIGEGAPAPEPEAPTPTPEAPPAGPAGMDREAILALVREEVARGIEGIPTPPPPEPSLSAEAITDLVRREVSREVVRGIEDHLEAALESTVRDLQERLEADQEKAIQATVTPLLTEAGERLKTEIQEQILGSVNEKIASEAERIQAQMLELQDQRNQRLEQKLTEEVLPKLISAQVEQERNQIVQITQNLIDNNLDHLTENAKLTAHIRNLAQTSAEQAAGQAAKQIAESVFQERSTQITAALGGKMYMLTGVAAVVGILAAVGVYFALS